MRLRDRPVLRLLIAALAVTGALLDVDLAGINWWDFVVVPLASLLACWLLVDEVVLRLQDALVRLDALRRDEAVANDDASGSGGT